MLFQRQPASKHHSNPNPFNFICFRSDRFSHIYGSTQYAAWISNWLHCPLHSSRPQPTHLPKNSLIVSVIFVSVGFLVYCCCCWACKFVPFREWHISVKLISVVFVCVCVSHYICIITSHTTFCYRYIFSLLFIHFDIVCVQSVHAFGIHIHILTIH